MPNTDKPIMAHGHLSHTEIHYGARVRSVSYALIIVYQVGRGCSLTSGWGTPPDSEFFMYLYVFLVHVCTRFDHSIIIFLALAGAFLVDVGPAAARPSATAAASTISRLIGTLTL